MRAKIDQIPDGTMDCVQYGSWPLWSSNLISDDAMRTICYMGVDLCVLKCYLRWRMMLMLYPVSWPVWSSYLQRLTDNVMIHCVRGDLTGPHICDIRKTLPRVAWTTVTNDTSQSRSYVIYGVLKKKIASRLILYIICKYWALLDLNLLTIYSLLLFI